MRRFRRTFAWLFVCATLLGAMHEILHHHPHDLEGHYEESCPLYLITQTPAIAAEPIRLSSPEAYFEPYLLAPTAPTPVLLTAARSRSPPLS